MSINLSEFESICRICIGTHETLPINSHRAVAGDITTALLLEYVLQLDYRSDDKLPQHMCRQCMGTLLHLYQFVRMARDSEQQLRKALETSTPDMPLTNKTNTINTFDLPAPKLSTLDMSPSVMNGTADIPASVASCEMNTETILIDTTTLGPPRLPIEDCRDYENHFEDAHEQLGSPPASESDYVLEDDFSLEPLSRNAFDHGVLSVGQPPLFIEHSPPLSTNTSASTSGHVDDNTEESPALAVNTNMDGAVSKSSTTKAFNFFCPFCNKPCRKRSNLIIHIRTHTGEKPYVCIHCGRRFNRSDGLRKHLRVHTGERPYTCKVCGRNFSDSQTLKYHLMMHTGEKPFKCTHCSSSFTNRTSLRVHSKKHTADDTHLLSLPTPPHHHY